MTHFPSPTSPPVLATYPRSFGCRLALALYRLLPRRPLGAGKLIAGAERRVGSVDWGDDGIAGDEVAGDLAVLLDSVARDVPLPRLGQAVLRDTIEDGLRLRLGIRAEAARPRRAATATHRPSTGARRRGPTGPVPELRRSLWGGGGARLTGLLPRRRDDLVRRGSKGRNAPQRDMGIRQV